MTLASGYPVCSALLLFSLFHGCSGNKPVPETAPPTASPDKETVRDSAASAAHASHGGKDSLPQLSSETLAGLPRDGGASYNRLVFEKSPYLLLHATNPVDWYPWGDAAFEKARTEGKPILLSIGYSTCHWCHVMERESFSDPE
ncbi:MAG: DUF255 domain-containing protein, partial [Gammaproteobacteria bacterium]|nr:DUF255 domain-containing protein [Gammaproteobacteria bacterium]